MAALQAYLKIKKRGGERATLRLRSALVGRMRLLAFENKRSFCSIDNVTYVVQQLIEKEIEPGIYQLADDEALSTNDLIRLIAASQNKKARIWHLPVKLIRLLARLGDFLHLPLNSERLKKLTESYVVSNQKIKKALGIEKMPVSAAEGMKKTFESFKK